MNERVSIFIKLVGKPKKKITKLDFDRPKPANEMSAVRRRKRLAKTVEELYPRSIFAKIYACSAHEYSNSEENSKMTMFLDLARLIEDGKMVKYRNSKFEIVYEPVRVLPRKDCVSCSESGSCEEDDSAE